MLNIDKSGTLFVPLPSFVLRLLVLLAFLYTSVGLYVAPVPTDSRIDFCVGFRLPVLVAHASISFLSVWLPCYCFIITQTHNIINPFLRKKNKEIFFSRCAL